MNPYELGEALDSQISVKMSKRLRSRLNDVYKTTGLQPNEMLRRIAAEVCEFYDHNGYISFPLNIAPELVKPQATNPQKGHPARPWRQAINYSVNEDSEFSPPMPTAPRRKKRVS